MILRIGARAGAAAIAAIALLGATAAAQAPKPRIPAKAVAPGETGTAAPVSQILITGARILDVEKGAYLPPAAVLIDKGRIVSVTPTAPAVSADAIVLALKGATLMPGLVDAHAWAAPTDDLDAEFFYALALAHGVTGYRVINPRTAWGVAQRERSASGAIDAPRLSTSGRGIDQAASYRRWLFDAPDDAAAAAEARQQVSAGVDWIAGYANLPPDAYRAMADALRRGKVRLSGTPGAASMMDLAAAGVQSIETLAYPIAPRKNGTDQAWPPVTISDLTPLVAALLKANVTLVPMIAAVRARAYPEEAARDDSLGWLPDARRRAFTDTLSPPKSEARAKALQAWERQAAFINRFVKAGGRVATGTDFERGAYPVPGIGVRREIEALVQAGLTPAEAIRAATLGGAILIGDAGAAAGIKPGLEADLMVVQGDPLANVSDLARITHVIRAGRVMDLPDLLARARAAVVARPK